MFSIKGVGLGQLVATACLATYYSSVMACIAIYLVNSFKNPLPWSKCLPEWERCIDAGGNYGLEANRSSALQEDNLMSLLINNITTLPDERIRTSSRFFFE